MTSFRALLVDDEEELVTTLVERLEIRGIEAKAAFNGTEALELARAETFDVIVLDVRLKGEDGIEIMEQINALSGPKVPIILMTGHTDRETSDKGLDAGALDYIVKPVEIEVLIDKMREGIELFRLGRGGKGGAT
jgi:DNA-binding response OmpR family regulator